MNSRLRSMMLVVGTMAIAGTSYLLATRQPPTITMAELRDAGAADERIARWVAVCPEKITAATARYLRRNGYGDFRAGTIHRVARVVWEYQTDAGAVVLNPSLVVTLPNDADGGGEDDETDDALQFRLEDCYRLECNALPDELRLLSDAGFRHLRADGGEVPWCNTATRRGRVTPPCAIPNCWTLSDGGWDDSAVVDCQGIGRFGSPVWLGCNTMPASISSGTQCVPVECTVQAGDNPPTVLR